MEVYKLGKTIENQKIEIQLFLNQLEEARDKLQCSLQRRKELAIQQSDTQYQEKDTTGLFENGNSSEFDIAVANLMEKINTLTEEAKNLKIEQKVQSILLCEAAEQKKKVEEDKVMIEDDKSVLINRLEEKTSDVQKLSNMQLDTMNQLMLANHELNGNDINITTLKLQNDQLRNELRAKKEFIERFNKPSEAIKHFEKLMKSPRPNNDTIGLGYSNTKEG